MRVSQIESVKYDAQAWDHLILDASTKVRIPALSTHLKSLRPCSILPDSDSIIG